MGHAYHRAMNTQTSQPKSDSLVAAYRHCAEIAARGTPNLYVAARYFENSDLFDAFCAAYASMRIIDDSIDDLPNRQNLSLEQKQEAHAAVQDWLEEVFSTFSLEPPEGKIWEALSDVFSKFDLPTDPWEELAAAMGMDIEMPYFKDWRTLQKYMRGASVAPAVVFMHLVLTELDDDEYICQWSFEEVVEATEDLAVFCYWTHILRDISRDLEVGENGLIYLPISELNQHGLTPDDLHRMKRERTASFAFKAMAEHLYRRARTFEQKGRQNLPKIAEVATKERWFALNLLMNIYSATLAKIEQIDFDVFAESGDLTVDEKRDVVLVTAGDCDMDALTVTEMFDEIHR